MNLSKLTTIQRKDLLFEKKGILLIYEYLFARIAQEYSNNNNISFEDFNTSNDISVKKLLLYPFFIATSNGHSKSLFELLGDFYALRMGPISTNVLKEFFTADKVFSLNKDVSQYFDFKNDILEVKKDLRLNNWDEIIHNILETKISNGNEDFKFKELEIDKDNSEVNKLYLGLESGIKTLVNQSNKKFFNFNEEILKFHSFKYSAYTEKIDSVSKVMQYDDIDRDKKKLPFYANN